MLTTEETKDICKAIIHQNIQFENELKARHTIIGVVEVINGNPNGDPATGTENLPRTNINGKGEISSMCLKRKIREFIKTRHEGESGYDMYCLRGSNVANTQDDLRDHVRTAFNEVCKEENISTKKAMDKLWEEHATEILLACLNDTFFDVRMFGCVATRLVKNPSSKKYVPQQVKGPIQVCDAVSCDVIPINQRTITATFGNKDENDRNFGTKAVVPYGLYVFHIDVSPIVARKTHMTQKDLDAFMDALKWIFELDNSASRGEQNLIALYDFEHGGDHPTYGAQPKREIYNSLKITKRPECKGLPTCLDDYDIVFDESHINDNVKVTRLA